MSLLANVKSNDADIANETDSVGGSGPLESGLYPTTVTMAYLNKSKGGALGLNLHLKTQDGREVRQTLWVASGDAKGNKTFYTARDGEKKFLPGYNNANSLALLTVGKEIGDLATEMKVVNVYSPDAGAEVPTQVEVIMDLLNQEILTGVQKQLVDKRSQGDDGQYRATGETREVNEIDKFFRARDRMTTAEIRAGAQSAEFANTWEAKWTGVTRDRTDKGGSAAPAKAGAPAAAAPGQKPTTSLFN